MVLTRTRSIGTEEYEKLSSHWARSSDKRAAMVVEPGSAEHIGEIVRHFLLIQGDVKPNSFVLLI